MLTLSRRSFITTTALGTLAGAGLVGTAHAAPTYKWRMATSWSGGPLMDIGAKAFAERLNFISGGRFNVEVFPAGTLGNPLKISDTVREGVAELGHTWMGYDWGKDPTTVLFGGYAGSFDTLRMLHWLYQGGGIKMQKQFRQEKFGVMSLPLFARNAEVFLHSRKPVRTLADLQGLKIRTAGIWLQLAKELGAATVTMPGGDIYEALQRGVIDATEWGSPWENISAGFYKVTKYVIMPGVHQPTAPFELVINNDVWNKLSDDDKTLVEEAAKLVTFESWLRIGQEDEKAIQFYRDHGNEIIYLAPEVQYRGRELALKWAVSESGKNEWFAKVYKDLRSFEKLWQHADTIRNVLVNPKDIDKYNI